MGLCVAFFSGRYKHAISSRARSATKRKEGGFMYLFIHYQADLVGMKDCVSAAGGCFLESAIPT